MPIFRRSHGDCGNSCGAGRVSAVQPSYQPAPVERHSDGSQVLAELGMSDGYDKNQARVALSENSRGILSIAGNASAGEAAAFRRATAAQMRQGVGTPVVDLASSDNIVSAGAELRQRIEQVPIRCGRRRVVYQQQVVTSVVESKQVQSQSVIINHIPDVMGRLHLSLGSQDRAFVDLTTIKTNCVISLAKNPGSAGKAVLMLGGGRPVENVSFDRSRGTAVLTVGGQEVSVSGISSPEDLLVASSTLDATQGVLADIEAVAAAVAGRSADSTRAETSKPNTSAEESQPPLSATAEPSADTRSDLERIIADKDGEIGELKAQLSEMKKQIEEMRALITSATSSPQPSESDPPPPSSPEPEVPESKPAAPAFKPAVNEKIDYAGRAGALNEQLSGWSFGIFESGLSAQLKVMHQLSDLTDEQARKLKAEYQKLYGRDLVADIEQRLSIGRTAALKAKLVGFNPDDLAKQMQANIDAWVRDNSTMLVDLVSNLSFERRQAVSEAFQRLVGKSVLAKLREDYAWNDNVTPIEPFLIGKDIPGLTEAAELYHLMDGIGSNDEPLILATLQRGEASPGDIARVFETYFATGYSKKTLLEVLQKELSKESFLKAKALIEAPTKE